MKSILLSIRPEWVCEILNGHKTIEIRRKFPKDYVGWVYIYCTKGKSLSVNMKMFFEGNDCIRNGKVVARFWCDKVGQISPRFDRDGDFEYYEICYKDIRDLVYGRDIEKETCLNDDQLDDYLVGCNNGYAIHISKLEVFDKPRNLYEFSPYNKNYTSNYTLSIKKAPQSYMFIEGEE